MKAYCNNCEEINQASFRPSEDAKTGAPYEDLCCDDCHYIIATITEREVSQPSIPEDVQLATDRLKAMFDVCMNTLRQIQTTPRNAGARRNANATVKFIESQQHKIAMLTASKEG